MKHYIKLFLLLLILQLSYSCTTTELTKQWKNPNIDTLAVSKILIVGMNPNLEARKKFEERLKIEFEKREIEAVKSLDIFDASFNTDTISEKELKSIENILISNYFDAVLFTKIKGVDDKVIYDNNYTKKEYLDVRFKQDYYNNRAILQNPKYYDKYKIYHAEISLYCICPTKERDLVWKGYVDIVDPKSIDQTVNDYVNLLVSALEEQNLLVKQTN